MLGSIIGDTVGSIYEFDNHKSKEFEFFGVDQWGRNCYFTDDSVMSLAIASALLDYKENNLPNIPFVEHMQKIGRQYPNCGYGEHFCTWMQTDNPRPYGSWGNGAAMRVAPCAWFANTLEEAEILAKQSSEVSHNDPEGIRGAQSTAAAIFMTRTGKSKQEIKEYIEKKYLYNLSRTCDEIRPFYTFDVSCQGTVPPAIMAFLESTSFEDAIRTAVSLGGDTDTLTAITGSIAEGFYGVPDWMIKYILSKVLDVNLATILKRTYTYLGLIPSN